VAAGRRSDGMALRGWRQHVRTHVAVRVMRAAEAWELLVSSVGWCWQKGWYRARFLAAKDMPDLHLTDAFNFN